jgi:hypothetical protein
MTFCLFKIIIRGIFLTPFYSGITSDIGKGEFTENLISLHRIKNTKLPFLSQINQFSMETMYPGINTPLNIRGTYSF